jgi:hypothetical protein
MKKGEIGFVGLPRLASPGDRKQIQRMRERTIANCRGEKSYASHLLVSDRIEILTSSPKRNTFKIGRYGISQTLPEAGVRNILKSRDQKLLWRLHAKPVMEWWVQWFLDPQAFPHVVGELCGI